MAASGDHRGLPEWVEFQWREPSYPELKREDFPSPPAFRDAVARKYAVLEIKTQKLEIKSRIPQEAVDAVIESKRNAPRGKLADKSLWLYLFWTPDGVKMRWALRSAGNSSNFGPAIQEGGDNLDMYNR